MAAHAVDVEPVIRVIRRQRVILAADLARIYGVETRALNQAVKRNADRFPSDFAFRLTEAEAKEVRRSRSQSVILKRGENIKFAPLAFTEHGAVMAASVLSSPRAVQMSVFVVRAFLRLREWAAGRTELSAKLSELERRVTGHDEDLKAIVAAIRQLVNPPERPLRKIGYSTGRDR
jgi:hypothetical protein